MPEKIREFLGFWFLGLWSPAFAEPSEGRLVPCLAAHNRGGSLLLLWLRRVRMMRLKQPAWPRVFSNRVVIACATLGPLGRRLPAPGTWGSLAGLLYFAVFFQYASTGAVLIGTGVGAYLAVGFCGEAEVRMRRRDPGAIVLDEVVALPLCFLGWRSLVAGAPDWALLLAGFALFRLFDILKPFGIGRLQALPGGWGVVADDLAAALLACAALHMGMWIWTQL